MGYPKEKVINNEERYKLRMKLQKLGYSAKSANRIAKQILITCTFFNSSTGKFEVKYEKVDDFVIISPHDVRNLSRSRAKYLSSEKRLYDQCVEREKQENSEKNRKLQRRTTVVDEINYCISNGRFKNGILTGLDNEQLFEKYKNVQLIDNPRLNSFLKDKLDFRDIRIKDYKDRRYGDFRWELTFIKYPDPYKIFLINHKWSDMNNAFMQCFSEAANNLRGNTEFNRSVRGMRYNIDYVNSLLNPQCPLISPRTPHGIIEPFKQKLFSLSDLYEKTTEKFKEAFEELLEEYQLKLEKVLGI